MGKALFRNSCQRGLLTVFKSTGSNPMSLWDLHLKGGCIKRYIDPLIRSMVFEIAGNNVSTSYMMCPKGDDVLGIVMPYLVMVVRNLHKYWSFEITILADDNIRRRFRVSNFQSTTQITQLCTAMPICLADGWNQIQFNLADFTTRAYSKTFAEVQKIKINANICLRRIYFAERLMADYELPMEYKLHLPISSRPKKKISGTVASAPDKGTAVPPAEEPQPVVAAQIPSYESGIAKESGSAKMEEQIQVQPQGSVTSKPSGEGKADAETSTSKRTSNASLKEIKEGPPSKETETMSAHASVTSHVQPLGSKTEQSENVEEAAPVEENTENEPQNENTNIESQEPPEGLENIPETTEEAVVSET